MPMHNWLDRYPLLHPDHAHDLERDAALNEFEHGMDRDKAEENAYDNYKRKQSAQAAAWHLTGMRSSAGKESQKHALMYASHIRSMGYDPSGPVPSEVKAHMDSDSFKHPVKFKAHGADGLLFNKVNKSEDIREELAKAVKKAKVTVHPEVARITNILKDFKAGKIPAHEVVGSGMAQGIPDTFVNGIENSGVFDAKFPSKLKGPEAGKQVRVVQGPESAISVEEGTYGQHHVMILDDVKSDSRPEDFDGFDDENTREYVINHHPMSRKGRANREDVRAALDAKDAQERAEAEAEAKRKATPIVQSPELKARVAAEKSNPTGTFSVFGPNYVPQKVQKKPAAPAAPAGSKYSAEFNPIWKKSEERMDSLKKAARIAIALEVVKRLNTLKKTAKSAILLEKLLKGNPMGMIPAFKHLPSGNVVKSPGFHDVDVLPGGEFTPEWEDGYVDETGKFYNRHDAAKALGTTHDTVDSFEIDPANPGYVQKSEEESSEASEPEKKLELQLPKKDRDIIASIREKLDKLFEPNEEIGPTPATVEAFEKLMGSKE